MKLDVEHADVVVIGAGISGIGAAISYKRAFPEKKLVILEAGASIGGTWATFTYPGVRSDSDMFSFAYSFRPWTSTSVYGDGATILKYVRDTAEEFDVSRLVRFNHKVVHACFSSKSAKWHIKMHGDVHEISCSFLFLGVGYYDHQRGHMPEWRGLSDYSGTLVHPQKWPHDLNLADKRVAVIGSGATAISLIPAISDKVRELVWIQRTPTYVVTRPAEDFFASFMLSIKKMLSVFLPSWLLFLVDIIIRIKFVFVSVFQYVISRRYPKPARKSILREIPLSEEVKAKHFTPPYAVWDQRVCVALEGDLFECIKKGSVKIFTNPEGIHSFSKNGLWLANDGTKGDFIAADVVIAATGLELVCMGSIKFFVDDAEVKPSNCVINRGCFLSTVPNMAFLFGYTNASWSLRLDITMAYVVRTLKRMETLGKSIFTPIFSKETNGGTQGVSELLDFSAGYIQRGLYMFPKQGLTHPWKLSQNVLEGYKTAFWSDQDDDSIVFSQS